MSCRVNALLSSLPSPKPPYSLSSFPIRYNMCMYEKSTNNSQTEFLPPSRCFKLCWTHPCLSITLQTCPLVIQLWSSNQEVPSDSVFLLKLSPVITTSNCYRLPRTGPGMCESGGGAFRVTVGTWHTRSETFLWLVHARSTALSWEGFSASFWQLPRTEWEDDPFSFSRIECLRESFVSSRTVNAPIQFHNTPESSCV